MVALREIAEQTVSPEDVKEDFIHSMQKYVEVDEPEPETVPLIGTEETAAPVLARDDQSTDTVIDRMTEEELLRGLESLTPADPSNAGSRAR